MGLTSQSSGLNILKKEFNLTSGCNNPVIALAGNPNTGKSTVFNELTGLKQHTGNWPGKTVIQAKGYFSHQGQQFMLVDLPGTYSLLANSTEELIARDFICFADPTVTIVVVDSTNLERNLNLVLQIMELTDNVILCLNLIDEAKRKGIQINIERLQNELKIPVIPTIARDGYGITALKETVFRVNSGEIKIKPYKIKYSPEVESKVTELEEKLEKRIGHLKNFINFHWLALRLLEGDQTILFSLEKYFVDYFPSKILSGESGVQASGVN